MIKFDPRFINKKKYKQLLSNTGCFLLEENCISDMSVTKKEMQIKQRKELRSKQEVNSETPGSYLPKMRVEKLRQQSQTDSLSLSAFTWNCLQQRKSYITLRYERKREIPPRRNPLEYIKYFLILDQSHVTKWLSILLLSDALDAGLPQELWLYQ